MKEKALREENAESFDKLFEETYGKYMTDDAMEVFKAEQYSVGSMLFSEGVSWEIDSIDVQEEADSYRYNVEIIVDGNESQRMVQKRAVRHDGALGAVFHPGRRIPGRQSQNLCGMGAVLLRDPQCRVRTAGVRVQSRVL